MFNKKYNTEREKKGAPLEGRAERKELIHLFV